MAPLITLLTDFGTSDSYVAEVKAVLLSRALGAALVDVTHQIPPGDVRSAQYVLARVWHRFPEGTVHLVVVDPGVGTSRRALAVEAAGRYFVAPDNGVLSPLPADARLLELPVPRGAASYVRRRGARAARRVRGERRGSGDRGAGRQCGEAAGGRRGSGGESLDDYRFSNPPDGVGILTFAITLSAKSADGASRASCASSRKNLRSRSAAARQSAHCARWIARVAPSRPMAHCSTSSGVRCCRGSVIVLSYAPRPARVSFPPVLEMDPQFVARPVDIRLHRAQRHVQDAGDLLVGMPFHVPQQDTGAVLGSQPPDGALDGAAQLARLDLLERVFPAAIELQGGRGYLVGRRGVRRPVDRQGVEVALA